MVAVSDRVGIEFPSKWSFQSSVGMPLEDIITFKY